jgi:hypothetical protein
MAAPAHWDAKLKAGDGAGQRTRQERAKQAWAAVRRGPVGLVSVPGQRVSSPARAARARQKPGYWGREAAPVVRSRGALPLPEANARTAALCRARVDWIEARPGRVPQYQEPAGLRDLPERAAACLAWQLSFAKGSPWLDKRVRHGAESLRQPL